MHNDLAPLLDPGPGVADPAFRVLVQARIMARAERRRAWRKNSLYLVMGAGLGLIGFGSSLIGLPPQMAAAAAIAAGLGLAFAAAPQYRRLPRVRL